MFFLCNEAIYIYKECLHQFENFSDKEHLCAMCFKELKWQMWARQYWIPTKILAAFEKQNYIFCKDINATWQPQLWRI